MKLDIKNAQSQVDNWIKTHGVRYFDISTNLIQLSEEVGEVGRIIARGYGEQSQKESDKQKDLSQELCDVLFVCLCIANDQKIDLLEVFQKKKLQEEVKTPQKEEILHLMGQLIIETGKIAERIISKNTKAKSDEVLIEHLSNLVIFLLKIASQSAIELNNRFIERLEEKALRDHNRNWTNEKLF